MYTSEDCAVNMDGNTNFADNIVEFNGGKNADRVFVF